jgi:hypothetical protein
MARSGGTLKRSGASKPQVSNTEAFKTAVGDSSPEDTTWKPASSGGRSKFDKGDAPGPDAKNPSYQMGGGVKERYSDSQPTVDKGKGGPPPQYDKPTPRKVGSKN